MRKCPSCNRIYQDDALSFCLEDGSPLLTVGGGNQPASFDPNATLQYTPSRETNPPPPPQQPGYSQPQFQPQMPVPSPSWSTLPSGGAVSSPPKKSKAVYWILGGVAALVVVGIIGVVMIISLAGSSNANVANNNANRKSDNANNSNAKPANSNSTEGSNKSYVLQDDFSNTANWWEGTNNFGTAEFVDGEYRLAAANYQGYIVVYGPVKNEYQTANATTRVTARSVTGTSPTLGYGLTIYSEMKDDILEDYSFVIRTDESPAFRVVLHRGGEESVLINWTRSSLIRSGTSPNQLEVRAKDSQLSFYINGQFATSVTDSADYQRGVVGFYSSDTEPVAFDDLEIYK